MTSVFPLKRPRILVVDDDRRVRLALRWFLEDDGYQVFEAANGAEALEEIISHAPDVMILDLAMPIFDGMRTMRELEGIHRQLGPRIIILSGWGFSPAANDAIELGADAFLEKPIDHQRLRETVARILSMAKNVGPAQSDSTDR